ncbi:MAG: hypothetical protein EAZ95_02750 [Bacteroidetes bacterium]|nr:MAG: hypothetical protein EAZ95_02750 [Bacteroidota bacterium]
MFDAKLDGTVQVAGISKDDKHVAMDLFFKGFNTALNSSPANKLPTEYAYVRGTLIKLMSIFSKDSVNK